MSNKQDSVTIKVPKGTKSIKIEFADTPANEGVSKSARKKICD